MLIRPPPLPLLPPEHPLRGQEHISNAHVALSAFPPRRRYFFSQANTSLCQYSLFVGLNTQWPSSGKLMNFDGTLSRCSVVNSCCPSLTGTRKSRSLWMMSIGVLNLSAKRCGEYFS